MIGDRGYHGQLRGYDMESMQGQHLGLPANMKVAALLCTAAGAYYAFVGPHERLVGIKAAKLEVVQVVGLAPAHHAGISMQARMWILCGLSARGALHRALPLSSNADASFGADALVPRAFRGGMHADTTHCSG